ncbi:MAG: FliH/SctL family protein [Defluviitaleaceae bacterium]|nr:FliH/SctL family protein [Defluviitaleaceae bacterium]
MMLSSNKRIYKPHMVSLDTENKIIIDSGSSSNIDDEPSDTNDPASAEKEARKAAKRIIRHAEQQAEEIVSQARITAVSEQESIRKGAEKEATRVLTEAKDMGYKKGMDAASRDGEAIKAEAQQLLDDAKSECKKMQENLEPEVVNMIISITEKLLGNIAEVNPAVIVNLVKQGFAATAISGSVTVYVSADDYDQVVENKDELLALTDGSVKLEITKDLSLAPLDCVIETPFGDVDCSLGHQFESIRANLTYILNNK